MSDNPSSPTENTTTRLTDEHGHLLGVVTGTRLTIKNGGRQGTWDLAQLTMYVCSKDVGRDTMES